MSRARDLAAFVSNADGDIKFDTDTLFIDSSANHVGIGTSSPDTTLHIADSASPTLQLTAYEGSQDCDVQILPIRADLSGSASVMAIKTNDGTSLNEVMRLDEDGNVGIGTTSPSYALSVAKTTTGTHAIDAVNNTTGAGSTRLILRNPSSDTNGNGFQIINNASDGNVNLLNYKNTALALWTNATERMRIDAVGNLAFNRTSATFASGYGIHMHDNRFVGFGAGNGTRPDFQIGSVNGSKLDIRCGNGADTADVNIDTSGNLQVGFESYASLGTVNTGCRWSGDATTNALARGSNGSILGFYSGSGSAGNISVSGASTSYNTSSDYRLKENVETLSGAITRVKTLKPKRFSWIEDGLDSPNIDGFLAHETQTVVPEAVTGSKDAMRDEEYEVTPAVYEDVVIPAVEEQLDEEGNVVVEAQPERTEQRLVSEAVMGTRSVPDYQGIDQAKLVPLLTAALQEAIAKIETLETKVAALESA